MINDMIRMFDDPHARHAMFVHFPIVLGALGVLPLIAFALTGFRAVNLRIVCIAWFCLASAGAGLAAGAGEDAEHHVEATTADFSQADHDAVHEHAELGEGGWMWPLIPAALVGLTLIDRKKIRLAAGSLAIVASLGVGGWVALTAHAGGELVYARGLGTPPRTPTSIAVPITPETPGAAGNTPATPDGAAPKPDADSDADDDDAG